MTSRCIFVKKLLFTFALLALLFSLLGCSMFSSEDAGNEVNNPNGDEQYAENEEVKNETKHDNDAENDASADEKAGSKGVFWKIENGENTVYLFGSVHIGAPHMYPLHEQIEGAFNKADVLAVEGNPNTKDEMEMMEYIYKYWFYEDESMIQDHISEELFLQLRDVLLDLGMYNEVMLSMKPYPLSQMMSSALFETYGYSSDYGIDYYFIDRAEGVIPIIELETFEDQLDPINKLSNESHVEVLEQFLEELENMEDDFSEMMTWWVEGNIAEFEKLRNKESAEPLPEDQYAFSKAFIDERDENMTEKIIEFLEGDEGKTYFVVVGALHLAGNNSIVDLLSSAGYNVEAVFNN